MVRSLTPSDNSCWRVMTPCWASRATRAASDSVSWHDCTVLVSVCHGCPDDVRWGEPGNGLTVDDRDRGPRGVESCALLAPKWVQKRTTVDSDGPGQALRQFRWPCADTGASWSDTSTSTDAPSSRGPGWWAPLRRPGPWPGRSRRRRATGSPAPEGGHRRVDARTSDPGLPDRRPPGAATTTSSWGRCTATSPQDRTWSLEPAAGRRADRGRRALGDPHHEPRRTRPRHAHERARRRPQPQLPEPHVGLAPDRARATSRGRARPASPRRARSCASSPASSRRRSSRIHQPLASVDFSGRRRGGHALAGAQPRAAGRQHPGLRRRHDDQSWFNREFRRQTAVTVELPPSTTPEYREKVAEVLLVHAEHRRV